MSPHRISYQGYFRIAAILLALAVIAGAFGAHALEAQLSAKDLQTYKTASLYQLIHGLGLLLVSGLYLDKEKSAKLKLVCYLLTLGTILFSGSLYLLVFTGVRWLGAITPLGGLCFISAWILLAVRARD